MRDRIGKFGPYLLLGAAFVMLIWLNISYGMNWIDSDMAAEMRFSKLLAEEGRLIATPNWYYSTEFRVLYTQLIMGPLFRITDNWHVIRIVTNLFFYVFLLAAYYYCMKPLKVRKQLVVLSSVILLLPFSETVMTHVHMGNTYIAHMILIFLFLGMFLRLTQGKEIGRGRRIEICCFYCILAAVCGISGVRYLLVLQCPLLLTAVIYLFRSDVFRQFRGQPDRQQFALLAASEEGRSLGYAVLGMLGSVAGYGINVLYVARNFTFRSYDFTNFIAVEEGFFDRIQYALGCLMLMLGYIPDKGVLSLRGLVTISVFLLLFILVFCTVKAFKKAGGKRFFVTLFLVVSFLLNVFVFVFTTSTMVPRYFLPVFILVLPMLCVYGEEEELKFDKAAVAVLLAGCLLLGTAKTVVSLIGNNKNANRQEVAEFLENSEYDFGFATYWNANIITEMTDGRVEIANINDPETLEYFMWSSPAKYYENGYHEGSVFLLLSWEEELEWLDSKTLRTGREIYDDGLYSIYVFESVEALKACGTSE